MGRPQPRISVTSPPPHASQPHELAIIRGTLSAFASDIYVSARRPALHAATRYPVVSRRFTALYRLQPGANAILVSLHADLRDAVTVHVTHAPPPQTSAVPRVRLVYLLSADGDGSFQSPESGAAPDDCNLAAGVQRLHTAGLLIQAAAADMLRAHRLGTRTFALCDDVLVHRLALTTDAARTRSGIELWQLIASDLAARAPYTRAGACINLALMSFSAMVDGSVRAHTALGGGALALFGGASLYAWPRDLHAVPAAFTDSRRVDARRFFDDSAGRAATQGRRAIAATTIGALLHELGHCLSLPHPCGEAACNGGGIMSRGFDLIDRLFVQPADGHPLPFWDRGSAVRLRYHRHIVGVGDAGDDSANGHAAENGHSAMATPRAAPTPAPSPPVRTLGARPRQGSEPPRIQREDNGSIHCRSAVGLGHVGFYRNGDNAAHVEFEDAATCPLDFELPLLADLRRLCQASDNDKLKISAIDVEGQITEVDYDALLV